MLKLLFIDTNIYLDFYRIRNESKTSFLEHLEAIKDSLIITDQVEMEFKKNRQSAILEGMQELKVPNKINVPAILKNEETATALEKDHKKIKEKVQVLKKRLDEVLEEPEIHDKVYQVLQRIFSKHQEIDLYNKHLKYHEIKELAKERFLLGYPPRKKNDTSIGDAINWEWLIEVAEIKNAEIWIVSRDSDYGTLQENKGFLNDWLKQEFRERTPKNTKMYLCPKLSIALREFEISVTEEEEKEEKRIISEVVKLSSNRSNVSLGDTVTFTILRRCVDCGSTFEALGDERLCNECI